jgi:hypothetical protein
VILGLETQRTPFRTLFLETNISGTAGTEVVKFFIKLYGSQTGICKELVLKSATVTDARGSATATPQVLEDEITLPFAETQPCEGLGTKIPVGLPLEP